MDYGSVTSGIEAATVAWHPLGWRPKWFSEIAPFPCKLLKHHYPHVPNLGDMMALETNPTFLNAVINLLVGGTPCQSFSLAGLRGGLADDRGNLALQYCRLLVIKQPRWFVWENVPGVFSSFSNGTPGEIVEGIGPGNGRDITETADFATLLNAFRECGYSCAWRVLDAQFFGVPQRRRRVFIVGYLGDDWRPPATVLFDGTGRQGNIKKSKKKGQAVAALTANGVGTCGADDNQAQAGHIVATLDASYGKLQGASGQDLNHGHSHLVVYGSNNQSGNIDVSAAINCKVGNNADFEAQSLVVAYPMNQIGGKFCRSNPKPNDPAPTLQTNEPLIIVPGVRRLTPLECERLQGFPDYYTAIPGAKDLPRYRALGNSMAVPVMRWLGARIDAVDRYLHLK